MNTKLRQLMNDEELEFFSHLTRLCPEGMIPLLKIKLTEFIFPSSEYGSDLFYHDFKELNKITVPFLIYSFRQKKPVCVIYYTANIDKQIREWLTSCGVAMFEIPSVRELYLNESLLSLISDSE